MSFKEQAAELLDWVHLVEPESMDILPIWVLDSGRLNEKKPARLTIAVPDDWVKNLNGDQPQDVYLLVKVSHKTHEQFVNWNHQPDAIKRATGIQLEQVRNKGGDDPVVNSEWAAHVP